MHYYCVGQPGSVVNGLGAEEKAGSVSYLTPTRPRLGNAAHLGQDYSCFPLLHMGCANLCAIQLV